MAEENSGSVNSVPLNYPLGVYDNYPFDTEAIRQEMESAVGEEVKDAVLKVVDKIGESFAKLSEDIRNLNSSNDSSDTTTNTESTTVASDTTPSVQSEKQEGKAVVQSTEQPSDNTPADADRIIQRVVEADNSNTERILSVLREHVEHAPTDVSAVSSTGAAGSESPMGMTMGANGATSAFIMTSVMAAMSMAFANPMVLLGGLIGGYFLWDSIKEPLTAYVQEKVESAKGWIKTEIASTVSSLGISNHLDMLSKAGPIMEKLEKLDFDTIVSVTDALKALKMNELVAAANNALGVLQKIPTDYLGVRTKVLELMAELVPERFGGRALKEAAKESREEFERLKKDFKSIKTENANVPQTAPIVQKVVDQSNDNGRTVKGETAAVTVVPSVVSLQPIVANAEPTETIADFLRPFNPVVSSFMAEGDAAGGMTTVYNVDKTSTNVVEQNSVSNNTTATSNTSNVTNNESTTVNNSVQQVNEIDMRGVEKAVSELRSVVVEKLDSNQQEFDKMKTFIQTNVVDKLNDGGRELPQAIPPRERMLFTPVTN